MPSTPTLTCSPSPDSNYCAVSNYPGSWDFDQWCVLPSARPSALVFKAPLQGQLGKDRRRQQERQDLRRRTRLQHRRLCPLLGRLLYLLDTLIIVNINGTSLPLPGGSRRLPGTFGTLQQNRQFRFKVK